MSWRIIALTVWAAPVVIVLIGLGIDLLLQYANPHPAPRGGERVHRSYPTG